MKSMMKFNLPKFTGTKDDKHDVYQWLQQLNTAGAALSWDEPLAIVHARLCLEGPALDFLDTLRGDALVSWTGFQSAFCERFGHQTEDLLNELLFMRQSHQEEVTEFCDIFTRLISRLQTLGETISETLMKRKFIEALHPSLGAAVTLNRPDSLIDAMESAKYFESQSTILNLSEVSHKAKLNSDHENIQSYQKDQDKTQNQYRQKDLPQKYCTHRNYKDERHYNIGPSKLINNRVFPAFPRDGGGLRQQIDSIIK